MKPGAILITGASGFAGSHLLPALAAALPTARIISASRRRDTMVDGRPAVWFDWDHPKSIQSILEEVRPDVIVNLSGEAAPVRAQTDPMAAWRSNFWQTLELAEVVRTILPDTSFVHISSGDIYGLTFQSSLLVDESQNLAPASPYGATKAAADLAVGEMALRGLHVIRLRPFNHTGPRQSPDFVIPALARQIARIEAGLQKPVVRTGALDTARDFLDVRDVCAAYVKIVERASAITAGAIFNIASGVSRPIGDVLRKLLEISGVAATIETDTARVRAHDISRICGDASKLRDYFDWRPTIAFDQTLSDTLNWWRGHLNGSN